MVWLESNKRTDVCMNINEHELSSVGRQEILMLSTQYGQ
jgi:hypothetical protein